MPYGLLGLCVVLFVVSIGQQEQQTGLLPEQKMQILMTENDSQLFINYRDGLMAFQQKNPSYTGTVSKSQLESIGFKYPSDFIARTGNEITAVSGGSGRTITAYGTLGQGAISEILYITENDASFGVALSNKWKSSAPGTNNQAVALETSVPDNAVVSVIRIGG